MLFSIFWDKKGRRFSVEDLIDMEFNDDDTEKLTSQFEHDLYASVDQWK